MCIIIWDNVFQNVVDIIVDQFICKIASFISTYSKLTKIMKNSTKVCF